MRWLSVPLFLFMTASVCLAAAPPVREMDATFFYTRLAPFGHWTESPKFGWVWGPSHVPVGWYPYTSGHWIDTDEGLAWVADEEWGWITFHYGRWFFDPDDGWLWVPGSVWSPGWVAWRRGPGFIGWAPLPPDFNWTFDSGLAFEFYDFDDIDYFWWSFVDDDDFFADELRARIHIHARNDDFLRRSENVTRHKLKDGHVRNEGFDDKTLEKMPHFRKERLRIKDVDESGGASWKPEKGEIPIYRPDIKGKLTPPPAEMSGTRRLPEKEATQKDLEDLLKHQAADHEELNKWHQEQIKSAVPAKPREPMYLQQRMENRRLEEQHGREMNQFENRHYGPSRGNRRIPQE